jgi:hypothetical protein
MNSTAMRLRNWIRQAGASPTEPLADAEYVRRLELSKLKSQSDVIALATRLERAAAAGYAEQVEALHDRRLTQLFAEICVDETIHRAERRGRGKSPGGRVRFRLRIAPHPPLSGGANKLDGWAVEPAGLCHSRSRGGLERHEERRCNRSRYFCPATVI